jgi:hypothetical protein
MRDGTWLTVPRGRGLLVILLACALWLPLQNLALLVLAFGAQGALRDAMELARPIALPLLIGAAVAWTAALTGGVLMVWAMQRRRIEGGRS